MGWQRALDRREWELASVFHAAQFPSLNVGLLWLYAGLLQACTSHVSRMYHACTWLAPPNPLPITWLAPGLYLACTWLSAALPRLSAFCFLLLLGGGFGFALMWLWAALLAASAFIIHHSAFAPAWLWMALPGHSAFRNPQSGIRIRPRVFSISNLNKTLLPRLPQGGLGVPWTNPGHVLVP